MKKTLSGAFAALTLALAAAQAPAQTFDFGDIPIWVGSGSNQAAMVVQWNDGTVPAALVWGYRWDGAASSLNMFQAIDAADPDFSSTLSDFGFGLFVDGIEYADGARSKGGWDGTNFWALYVSQGSPYGGSGSWASSFVGMSDRALSNGSWDGWSHSPGELSDAPVIPLAVVPEPSTFSFLVIGGLMLLRRLRND